MNTVKLIALTLILGLFSCNKEKFWTAEIVTLNTDSTEVEIGVDYVLERNNDFLYVGICISESPNPTISNYNKELQKKNSGQSTFYFDNLSYGSQYYAKGFIKKHNSTEVIYSEEFAFKTDSAPTAPCETEVGKISYNGSNFTMSPPYESTTDSYYKISTSGGFGELDFKFNAKPTKNNLYTMVDSDTYLSANKMSVSGVLGMGWLTCFHRAGNTGRVYVEVTEAGAVIIKMCDLKMHPSGSCEGTPLLTGAIQVD